MFAIIGVYANIPRFSHQSSLSALPGTSLSSGPQGASSPHLHRLSGGRFSILHPGKAPDRRIFGLYPFLRKLFADSAYEGPIFHSALASILPGLETEIVKRSDKLKGFVALPKRWIVERTIAWLNRCRRLAKDWENLNRNALAFLKLASIRLMLRKLCNPS